MLKLRVAFALFTFCLPSAFALAADQEEGSRSNPPALTDPGESIVAASLSPEEEQALRGLFEQLGAKEFDQRDAALQRLVARGPAILALAEEFAKSSDVEVAKAAQSLRGKILLDYDGYVPADPKLLRLLDREMELQAVRGEDSTLQVLRRLAQSAGVPLVFDQRFKPREGAPVERIELEPRLGKKLEALAQLCGGVAVVRGAVLVITTPEVAQRLKHQRYTFDWKSLGLEREEAARIGEGLKAFFPDVSTEIHTGSEALSVRGRADCIPRAARLIALLRPGSPEGLWPAPEAPGEAVDVAAALAKPASVNLYQDDPALLLEDLRKQGHQVNFWVHGRDVSAAPYPAEVQGLAPLSLSMKNVPVGLVLRWFTHRACFAGGNQTDLALQAEADMRGRIRIRVNPKARDVLQWTVGGTDADPVLPPPPDPPSREKLDQNLQDRLVQVLRPHLELFPDFAIENDLRVLRGRVLVQGSPAAVQRVLDLVRRWKTEGRPPPCPWSEGMRASLDREVEWDGRGLTAGTLLSRLRALGKFSILIEDSSEGLAAQFSLTSAQAALLPPGKYPLHALLDDLAEKSKGRWETRWGVVVLTPEPKKEQRKPAGLRETPEEKGTAKGF